MKVMTPSSSSAPLPGSSRTPAAGSRPTVLRLSDGASAQAELSRIFGPSAHIHEAPLTGWSRTGPPDAQDPVVVWVDTPTPGQVADVHRGMPRSGLMVSLPRGATPGSVVQMIAAGADLVVRDEGPVLSAASLFSLSRRFTPRHQPAAAEDAPPDPPPQRPANAHGWALAGLLNQLPAVRSGTTGLTQA
jgi:hypothetical protein